MDFQPGITDEALRAELLAFAKENGAEALHAELRRIDPESAEQIHPNNVKRVARAIEIYRLGGVKKSDIDKASRCGETRFEARCVCLSYTDRADLYGRIDRRVDDMIASGLERETRELLAEGVFEKNFTAAQAIGYKELLPYVAGEKKLDDAVDDLKTATRRYAKRQITWFSSKKYVTSIDVSGSESKKTFEDIVNIAAEVFFS